MGLSGGLATARADTSSTTDATLLTPMRFVLVRADDPECQPNCPQWVSAEGKIELGTAQAFSRMIDGLGARRLPIIVNSLGGSVPDAIAMGRLIRADGLAVVVGRTVPDPCPAGSTICRGARGDALTAGAVCASACPLLLAGGVERYASRRGNIGVHQPTETSVSSRVERRYSILYQTVGGVRQEISRTLIDENRTETTSKQAASEETQSSIDAYLKEMGIAPKIAELIRTTPADGARWLNAGELADSGLVTIWVDRPSAIIGGAGANGLAGVPVKPASGHGANIMGRTSVPLVPPVRGETINFEVNIAYLRGGGTVEASFGIRDASGKSIADTRGQGMALTLSPGGSTYRLMTPEDGSPARVTLPLDTFCNLSRQGRLIVRPVDGSAADVAPPANDAEAGAAVMTLELAAGTGMRDLFAEACGV